MRQDFGGNRVILSCGPSSSSLNFTFCFAVATTARQPKPLIAFDEPRGEMGKKKRKFASIEETLARPWCYYCERDFDDLKILISHQACVANAVPLLYRRLTLHRKQNITNANDAAGDSTQPAV